MAKKYCSNCGEKIGGIFGWQEVECSECEKKGCADCLEISSHYFLHREMCSDCKSGVEFGVSAIVKVVKSDHVGGHSLIKSFDKIHGSHWEPDQQDTINNIKFQASELGANAIISLKIDKNTASTFTSNLKGIYYYSQFLASGVPAIIKKYKSKDIYSEVGNMGVRTIKMLSIKDGGHITEKEITKAIASDSLTTEIFKLISLKKRGHITEREFKKAKDKLFSQK